MRIARVERPDELLAVPATLDLGEPRPVVVLVGGADGLDPETAAGLEATLAGLAGAAAAFGAAVVDGATDAGVGRLIGRARKAGNYGFPLVGVAVASLVVEPGDEPQGEQSPLEPNHTHVVLVPGSRWGDEVPWLESVAELIARDGPSVTVLVNGGEIALADVEASLATGRRVLVVAGSGRTADRIAAALEGDAADGPIRDMAASGLVTAVGLGEDMGAAVARELESPAAGR